MTGSSSRAGIASSLLPEFTYATELRQEFTKYTKALKPAPSRHTGLVDHEHLGEERWHLPDVFLRNGYSIREIRTFTWYDLKQHRGRLRAKEEEQIQAVAAVPCCPTVTNRLASQFSCRNIRTTFYPLHKLKQQLHQVKDTLGLKVRHIDYPVNVVLAM